MINDLRKQNRRITIEVEKTGYDYDLDEYIDKIVKDFRIIMEQTPEHHQLEITLTLE